MGVGRRMKKQGPPPDLGKIKRPPSAKRQRVNEDTRGKKRKASGEIKVSGPQKKDRDEKARSGHTIVASIKAANGAVNGANKGKPNAQPSKIGSKSFGEDEEISSDDDAADLLGNGDDDSEDLNMIDGSGEDGLEEGVGDLGDDFLDSESSVVDSDDQRGNAIFSEDEDSDWEERLTAANIEGLSRKLDVEQDQENEEARLEEAGMQTNIDGDDANVFGEDGDTTQSRLAPDLQVLRSRITDTVRILDNFSSLAEKSRSRTDYTTQLLKDICLYYGYSPYLAEKLFNLFAPKEAFAFFEANETARPVVIRTNTLRTHRRQLAQSLINRGVTLEPVGKWSKVGLQVFESQVPLGATPEYLAGHYILQAASSFLPVMALAPQEDERVLDMAAAPGGKTTYIAALMKNTGCIFANDSNKQRAKGLIGNIHRLGARNTIVCNHDAREFPRVIGGFDRVLLDAPCSGTGVIAKDPSVKTNKTEKDFMLLPHLQKQLLLCAIDSVDHNSKTGGYIVYSTCSVTVEENEQVVQYALNKRPNVKLVETGLTFGVDGFTSYMGKQFDPRMKMTKRYYPHAYNVDGFFVSKFKKMGASPAGSSNGVANGGNGVEYHDFEDSAPIVDEDGVEETDDGFGGWDEEEDAEYMERAQRRRLKKKGVDPKGVVGRTHPKRAADEVAVAGGRDAEMSAEKEALTLKGRTSQGTKIELTVTK